MARMTCRCGEHLSNSQSPNDIELTVYTDREWDEMFSGIDTIPPYEIPLPKYSVWRCPKCARVYVFNDSDPVPVMVYALEK
ncbi:MAG: hypothetical protein J6Z29_10485 [Ruminococcus sp.]|uniref:Uncharacterized protein n=1 Tax=Ruminococcus albus TaxID=1264 RepID=A0A1H7KFC5_RUMAL|nr:hypothetical protein [Ruminococcus albus]MBP5268971.1 hypothetical protein [Ruminococcus sp.]SEK85214.1 hypothetical protein SAMN05216469_106189 [Ruminococcus albus]